jgi:recombination protein RecA
MARSPKAAKEEKGRISISQMREMINKKAGTNVAFDLTQDNPSDVTEWISTGSHVLDSIICRGKKGGIPAGRITELAGLEASGKSYLAAQIAANAQKQGFDVVYFDSESSLDSDFLEKAGCDVGNIIYAQAASIEFVLETVEDLLGSNQNKMLFILDSFAFTPCLADINGDFNPQSSMAMKPRIMSKGLTKLIQPIANSGSAFLVLNQLKQNIVVGPTAHVEMMMNPFIVPGGKALAYAYSLRIWLTGRKSKSSYVISENGYRIGSETKCTLKKSRFGTEGRECSIKLLWGGDRIHVQDEDAWMEVIKNSEQVMVGPWWTVKYADGSINKFRSADFLQELANPKFRNRVIEIVEDELITKFDQQKGNAAAFYNLDEDGVVSQAPDDEE